MVADGATGLPQTIRPKRVDRVYVEIPLFCFGVAVILATLGPGITQKTDWGVTQYSALVLVLVVLVGLLGFLWADLIHLSAALTSDTLYLPFYIAPPLRTLRRRVPLSEIEDAIPDLDGVDIFLKVGIRIFLDRRYFGRNGTEVVSRLSAQSRKSYRQAVDDAVAKELMQVTLSGQRVRGDTVYLNRPLFSYSGVEVTKIRPEDIVRAARFKTARGTAGFRMELADSSPFFIADSEIDRLGLGVSRGWTSKLSPALHES